MSANTAAVPDVERANESNPTLVGVDDNNSASTPHSLKPEEDGDGMQPAMQSARPKFLDDAPDGGTTAWLVVAGAWCTSFCSFGWINSVGTFQEYFQSSLLRQYSASTIAWIPSMQVFFMMGMGPIIGSLYDRYGPRYLILGGSFLHVFGLMMASISTEYYQIMLAQGVCSAIGVSAIFQPSLNTIIGWFNKKRGMAYGLLATGSSVGGVVFPILVSRLIKDVGFGWAMRVSAFLILVLLTFANLTVKSRHPPNPQKITGQQLVQPFREIQFILITVGIFLFTFGMFGPITYLPVQAIQAGMDPDLARYLVAMLNAASLFGRIFSGILGDKIGKYNIFVVVCYTTGILILALWIPASTDGAIIAFAVLFGFFSGAYVSLLAALVAQISPLRDIGFRTGMVFFASAFGGLVTGPICGAILGQNGGWLGLKIFCGVFCIAGTSCILAARIHATGLKFAVVF